ncbi:MAG: signal peptidase II [Spirochaetia bacterium]|nr:signal peptidase II [Spirochaetia bacterium]
MWAFFITAVLVTVSDQIAKLFVRDHMRIYESIQVIPGFARITHIDNYGIALGMLGQSELQWKRWLLVGVIFIAMLVIVVYWWKYDKKNFLYDLSCGLILGGAMGNFIDRAVLGKVTDFIELGYRNWSFPVFNIADIAISFGVAFFILHLLLTGDESERDPKGGNDASTTV